MRWKSRMVLWSFAVTAVAITGLISNNYRVASWRLQKQHAHQFWSLTRAVAGALRQQEEADNRALVNALWALQQADGPHLGSAELADLSAETDTACLGYFDKDGWSGRFSCDTHAALPINVFDLAQDYPFRLQEEGEVIVTPFAMKAAANVYGVAAEKFAYVQSHHTGRILTASVLARSLSPFLQSALDSAEDIVAVRLLAPGGEELAAAHREGETASGRKATVTLERLVASAGLPCSECVQKGQTTDANVYAYRLQVTVSLLSLAADIEALRWRAVWGWWGAMAMALLAAFVFTTSLARRLRSMSRTAHRIIDSCQQGLRFADAQRGDEVAELAASCNDMLARLEAHERLHIEREKMASTARLAAQVAHDIRSPVTALQVALRHIDGLEPDTHQLIGDAVGRIGDIANNLMAHYTSPHGAESRASPHRLAALLSSVVGEHRLVRSSANMRIALQVSPAAQTAHANVDGALFCRVVSNLLNNAAEASPEGATLTVRLDADGTWVRLEIVDRGRGMRAQVLARVLAHGESVDKPGGAGLGLSMAQQSVQQWGGRLSLESQAGRGTRVAVVLPQVDSVASPLQLAAVRDPAAGCPS